MHSFEEHDGEYNRQSIMKISYEELLSGVQRYAGNRDFEGLKRLKTEVDRSSVLNEDQKQMLYAKIKAATPPDL